MHGCIYYIREETTILSYPVRFKTDLRACGTYIHIYVCSILKYWCLNQLGDIYVGIVYITNITMYSYATKVYTTKYYISVCLCDGEAGAAR